MLFILLMVLLSILGVAVYIFPTVLAFKINHPKKHLILIINMLFGWTVLGWAISMIIVGNKKTLKEMNLLK